MKIIQENNQKNIFKSFKVTIEIENIHELISLYGRIAHYADSTVKQAFNCDQKIKKCFNTNEVDMMPLYYYLKSKMIENELLIEEKIEKEEEEEGEKI